LVLAVSLDFMKL